MDNQALDDFARDFEQMIEKHRHLDELKIKTVKVLRDERAMRRWIPVGDRMPHNLDGLVQVKTKKGHVFSAIPNHKHKDGKLLEASWTMCEFYIDLNPEHVTHWRKGGV